MAVVLGVHGFDVVGFKHEDDEKYCRDCYYQMIPLGMTMKIRPILRAVIVQSPIKNCHSCGKDLSEIPMEKKCFDPSCRCSKEGTENE